MIDQWGKGAKYWDKAFNPVIGCEKVSEGCEHCYAEAMCERFPTLNGYEFRPKVKFGSKPPKTGVVFVGNMTDIFGYWNGLETIDEITENLSKEAINLLLTKRADGLAFWLNSKATKKPYHPEHIMFGITAENQNRFSERTAFLPHVQEDLDVSFWLSAEPLLGQINLDRNAQIVHPENEGYGVPIAKAFDWVVVGAESGQNRRPCKLEWVESIVDSCQYRDIPVFVKQLDLNGKLVTDINKFPEHLQIRQVPWMERAKQ